MALTSFVGNWAQLKTNSKQQRASKNRKIKSINPADLKKNEKFWLSHPFHQVFILHATVIAWISLKIYWVKNPQMIHAFGTRLHEIKNMLIPKEIEGTIKKCLQVRHMCSKLCIFGRNGNKSRDCAKDHDARPCNLNSIHVTSFGEVRHSHNPKKSQKSSSGKGRL